MNLWLRRPAREHPRQRSRLRLRGTSFWLEGLALPLGAIALETLPLGAWLQFGAAAATNDVSQALLPTWALVGTVLGVYYLTRRLIKHPLPQNWSGLLIGLGWALTLLITLYLRLFASYGAFWQIDQLGAQIGNDTANSGLVTAAIGLALLVTYLWWRGVRLGSAGISFDGVARVFKIGFAALIAVILLVGTVAPTARVQLGVRLGLTLLLFLFAGLASLSLSRLTEIRQQSRERGGAQMNPTRAWVVAMLALSVGLVLLLFGIEQIFSYQTWLGFVAFIQPVLDGIGTAIGWIIGALGYVLFLIFSPVAQFIASLVAQGKQLKQPSQTAGHKQPAPSNNGTPTEWLVAAQWILIAVGILVVLWIIIRMLRRLELRLGDKDVDEERESLGVSRMLGAQLRALLANLAARFRRKGSEGEAAAPEQVNAVRLLYRRVLQQAEVRGLGRRSPETPGEFARRLAPALTGAASDQPQGLTGEVDLQALTVAYEQARYGDQEPSPAQLAALTEETDRLLLRLAEPVPPAPPSNTKPS